MRALRSSRKIFLKFSQKKRNSVIRQQRKRRLFKINIKKVGIIIGIFLFPISLFAGYNIFSQNLVLSLQPDSVEDKEIVSPLGGQNSFDNLKVALNKTHLDVVDFQRAEDGVSVVARISGDISVTFSLSKDLTWQVSTLQQLLRQLTIEGSGNKKPTIIDFRFDKPIVKFQ